MRLNNHNYDVLEYLPCWTVTAYKENGTKIFVSQNHYLEVAQDRAMHFLDNNKDFDRCEIMETRSHYDVRRKIKNG